MKTLFKVLCIGIIGVFILILIFDIGLDLIMTGNLNLGRDLDTTENTIWMMLKISLDENAFDVAKRNIQIAQSPEFSKVAEQLASDKLEIRINGINALEDIAKDSKNRQPAIKVLTTFVKKNSSADEFYKLNPQTYQLNPPKISLDIQAILNVLSVICLRNKTDEINAEIDLARTHLVGANLSKACLSNFYFIGANLSNADLSGADISGSDFVNANLSGANLSGANLSLGNIYSEGNIEKFRFGKILLLKHPNFGGTNLSGANLAGVDLTGVSGFVGTNFSGANLSGANLSGEGLNLSNLSGANLSGANLSGVNFHFANLSEADFSQANLSNVKDLIISQLSMVKSLDNVKGLESALLDQVQEEKHKQPDAKRCSGGQSYSGRSDGSVEVRCYSESTIK